VRLRLPDNHIDRHLPSVANRLACRALVLVNAVTGEVEASTHATMIRLGVQSRRRFDPFA
jgi:hypothetical protein